MTTKKDFSHFDAAGNARMVDVSDKLITPRRATARGEISMSRQAFSRLKQGTVSKGDVLGIARIAGIMASKKVDQLIPLCHSLALSGVDIDFGILDERCSVEIEATVLSTGQTGVEMEALTAVSVAALTIYDMCKALDKGMVISGICLLKKSGGKSGSYTRHSETINNNVD